ncbi:MAG: hypothetical protein IT508_03090 [Burkholderiaceae bacterium]|nr:hypothetical protein [Burkholderiaceae bacterium]
MSDFTDPLRLEIAAVAAGLIADGGLDYAEAKKKAARQVLGEAGASRRALPDNEAIDEALREHLSLFDPDHGARVSRRRQAAAELMLRLAPFQPYLTGAVWKGIVAEHAPIHLQLFHDNAKEVEIHLLNEDVDFDVTTSAHFRGGDDVEAIVFYLGEEPVLLTLYRQDELRGALKGRASGPERGDRRALLARLAQAA